MKNQITEYRKKLGLTQQELGDIVGVTRQTIISLEQFKYNPSLMLAYRLTKALKAKDIQELFIFEG